MKEKAKIWKLAEFEIWPLDGATIAVTSNICFLFILFIISNI